MKRLAWWDILVALGALALVFFVAWGFFQPDPYAVMYQRGVRGRAIL